MTKEKEIKTSTKLTRWVLDFYGYSADIFNQESKLKEEFKRMREIIKEVRRLERR